MRKSRKNGVSYTIPFDKGELKFSIPSKCTFVEIKSNSDESIKDLNERIKNTLSNPINSPPLSDLIKGKKSACIVVTDNTRNCPDKEILPHLLNIIKKHIDEKNITIIVGTGMHRKMSQQEKIDKFGKNIVDDYQVVDHDPQDESKLVSLGHTKNGIPIKISKIAYESDLLISIGLINLHQYAGYSGGYKTVSIGIASDETISNMHSLKMLKNSKARIGNIEENPFQEDIIEIGNKAGLDFIINVVLGNDKKVLEIQGGEPMKTYKTLIKKAKSIFETKVKGQFDVIICGVGYPSDSNLYLASRAASFIALGNTPPIRKDGYIIIPAKCAEGAGKGIGEQRFMTMLENNSQDEILESKHEFLAGEQRAFVIAKVLKYCKIIIVGSDFPKIIKNTGMIPADSMNEAFQIVKNDVGEKFKIASIPNSLITLPVVTIK